MFWLYRFVCCKKFALIIFLCFTVGNLLLAQTTTNLHGNEPCGFATIIEQLEAQYPGFKEKYDAETRKLLKPRVVLEQRKKYITDTIFYYDTVYTIPVVFHVLYNVANENIEDSLLLSQIEVLNRDFNRRNPDSVKTRAIFKSRAGSARIEFIFASKNPTGAVTNGIVRKPTTKVTFGANGQLQDLMKSSATAGDDPWDPSRYLNIWVCDLSLNNQDNLLGYAFPPYGHPSWTSSSWVADARQGVVLHYKVVGRNNPRATGVISVSKMGRCAVHEVGHYLGLRHIWADDQFSTNKCLVDDYIDDTPLQGIGANFGCNLGGNTCIEPKNDLPDMFENYMDYSSEACQNIYTKQQVSMMRRSITDYRLDLPIKIDIIKRMRVFDTVVYDDILIYSIDSEKHVKVEIKNQDILDQLEIQFYNMLGEVVSEAKKLVGNETNISTLTWRPGVYIAVLKRSGDQKIIRKQRIFVD